MTAPAAAAALALTGAAREAAIAEARARRAAEKARWAAKAEAAAAKKAAEAAAEAAPAPKASRRYVAAVEVYYPEDGETLILSRHSSVELAEKAARTQNNRDNGTVARVISL